MKYFAVLLNPALLFMLSASVCALEVVDLGKVSAWNQSRKIKAAPDGSLLAAKEPVLLTSQFFPVDPDKTYTLQLTVSTDKGSSRVLAGFEGFLSPGLPIGPRCVKAVPGSFAMLLEDAPKGSKSIKIPAEEKDTEKILPRSHYFLIANAKKDFSDLPNFNRVAGNLERIDKDGNILTLTFKTPLSRTLKKGTPVRLHQDGAYMYSAGIRYATPEKAVMKGSVKGFAEPGTFDYHQWPVKSKLGRVVLLINWTNQNVETRISDIKLTVE